jgi:tRNA-specific 2-thiouridylase
MAKVLVAMSGGVDSSLSAYLLLQQGYEVIGATMNFLDVLSPSINDAKVVAEQLGITHYVFNLQEEFQKEVLQPFLLGYSKGITPNPCVLCNRMIKFGVLWERAKELGCSHIATGHYARISTDEKGRKILLKGKAEKEQSYFLYNIKAELLEKIVFPLGDWDDKEMVREKAREIGLLVADKEESKDLCFVKGGDYRDLLKRHFPDAFKEGAIIDSEGKFRGFHKGIANYTIGQREGLGIALGERYYVKGIRADDNTIVVGREEEIEARDIWADNLNWLVEPPKEGEMVGAKIRYGSPEKPAKIFWDGELLRVEFQEPVRAPALGQSVVLYRDEIVLGGGIICRISWLK